MDLTYDKIGLMIIVMLVKPLTVFYRSTYLILTNYVYFRYCQTMEN